MFPEIRLTSSFGISTYFLLISIACVLGSLYFIRRASQRKLDRLTAIDLTITCLVCGFLGARLLHVFYEDWSFYTQNPWDVLKVWNGGFVFLGGVVGAWVGAAVFCSLKREPFWFWADAAAPAVALAYGLGRLACFLNGCCYGKFCELPWAVTLHGHPRHPTQLYASLWELALVGLLVKLEPRFKHSGVLFNVWLLGHAAGRVLMETFRDDPRGDLILGTSLGIFMSLWLASFAAFNLVAVQIRHRH